MSHLLDPSVRALAAPVLLLAGLAAPATAQNATYTYFGTPARVSCSPVQTVVQHTALGTPQLGTTFTVQMPASNGDCSYLCNLWFLATGFSNTTFQGVPLPYTPPLFGAPVPSCGSLLVSLDRIEAASLGAGTGSQVQFSLQIPNATNLVGLEFFQQPFAFTFVLGGLNTIALGRAGHGTIGY